MKEERDNLREELERKDHFLMSMIRRLPELETGEQNEARIRSSWWDRMDKKKGRNEDMGFNIDADPNNADWIKQSWNLPPYKSDEFYEWLEYSGINLEQFRELPLYKNMVKKGLIKDDEWVGKGEE